eukprot:15904074-Heterocapsa_arctica.AAC.1
MKNKALEEHLENMPCVSLEVDPSSHAFIVDSHIGHGLEMCFPKPLFRKRQECIPDGTFALIARQGRVHKALTAVG